MAIKSVPRKVFGSSRAPVKFSGKMTCFLGLELLVHFEKHPKAVSGALRDRFRAREVIGAFEKRTPERIQTDPKQDLRFLSTSFGPGRFQNLQIAPLDPWERVL